MAFATELSLTYNLELNLCMMVLLCEMSNSFIDVEWMNSSIPEYILLFCKQIV